MTTTTNPADRFLAHLREQAREKTAAEAQRDELARLHTSVTSRQKRAGKIGDEAVYTGGTALIILLTAAAVGLTAHYTRDPMWVFISFIACIGVLAALGVLVGAIRGLYAVGLYVAAGVADWRALILERDIEREDRERGAAAAVEVAAAMVPTLPGPRAFSTPTSPNPPVIDDDEIRIFVDLDDVDDPFDSTKEK